MTLPAPFHRRAANRRGRNRISARLPASLQTPAGSLPGLLTDLSVTGARFMLSDRETRHQTLQVGRNVVLRWSRFEAFATILWESRGIFGLQFDPLVAPGVLVTTREADDAHARLASQSGYA